MSRVRLLIAELKRRKVFRVAGVYAAAAFVIWQAADFVLPALNVPDWVATVVVVLTLAGFPIALILAWALETTPEGVRRTPPIAAGGAASTAGAKVSPGPVALVAAVVILAGAGSWFWLTRDGGSSLVRERIVVLPFENRTGDPAMDELGGLAADWISAGLNQAGIFEVVPMRIVNQRLEGDVSGDPLRALADYTEAGTFVTGSYYLRGDSVEVHAELLDARQERPALLSTVQPASGPERDPLDAIERVKQRAAGALAQRLERDTRVPELYSPPPSLAAYQEYRRGQDLFSRMQFREANVHFYRAVELDSTYLTPLTDLAASHGNLGESVKEDSLVRILEANRARLTPLERAWTDWLRGWIDGDLDLEYRAAQQGVRLAPFLWAYAAGITALRANRPAEADRHFSRRDFSTFWERQWAPWWSQHLYALHQLGKHEEELEVAREARVAHPDYWAFPDREAWALVALGRLDELEGLLEELVHRPAQGSWNPGRVMRHTVVELRAHGHEEAADRLVERALAYYESPIAKEWAGDPPSRAYRNQLAQILYHAGRWDDARRLFEELVSEYPEAGGYLGWLGITYARQGERDRALEVSERLEEFAARPYARGGPTNMRAGIAAVLGERERSVNLLRQAFAEGRNYGYLWIHKAHVFWSLHDYPPFQELVKPKG